MFYFLLGNKTLCELCHAKATAKNTKKKFTKDPEEAELPEIDGTQKSYEIDFANPLPTNILACSMPFGALYFHDIICRIKYSYTRPL